MEKKIVLGYNPNLKIKEIQSILITHFPEYGLSVQTWGFNAPFVRLKKSFFVHAVVFIKQQPKKKRTIVGINGNMAPLAVYCFGLILHYILRGNFLNEVKDALEQELQ